MLDLFRLTGKVALVTGSAAGLGAAMALALAQAGASVAVHGNRRSAAETATQINGDAAAFSADLGDPDGARQLFDSVIAHFGRIDILINNAGPFIATPQRMSRWKTGTMSCR